MYNPKKIAFYTIFHLSHFQCNLVTRNFQVSEMPQESGNSRVQQGTKKRIVEQQ